MLRVAPFALLLALVAGCAAAEAEETDSADGAYSASTSSDGFLARSRSARLVGELPTGYLGIVDTTRSTTDLKRGVADINIKRRALYTETATRRGVTVETVAKATACVLYRDKIAVGEMFQAEDGSWERRGATESVPMPEFCAAIL